MKYTARVASIATLLSLSVNAAPFMAVGDGAELFVTAGLSVQLDDNIYLDSTNERDDTIISFTPGVDLVFGKGTATAGSVYYREEFRRYNDNDNQDTELSNVGFRTSTDTGSSKFDFNGSYAQIVQNDNDVRATGALVRREVTNLGGSAEFGFTAKTSIGIGASLVSTDYAPAAYTDADVLNVPVDVYYAATEKLDWSLGYRYRDTNQSGVSPDFNDHFVNIGARGEFSPKLSGQVRVGYNSREFSSVGSDQSGLGVDANLSLAATAKTTVRLFLSNDFSNSSQGESTEVLRWGGSVDSKISEQLYVTASLSLSSSEYPTRDDDYLDSLVALTYSYNQFVNFSASVAIRDNDSTSANARFDNTVFSFGANIRY